MTPGNGEPEFSSKVKRTNVRPFELRRVLPIVFPLLSRFSSALSSWWAEKLFFTPARHVAPSEESLFLRKGIQKVTDYRGRQIVTWTFGQESRPTVLLVHGWAGRGGQLRAFVDPLVDAGFSVVLFDAPAHGSSEGRRTNLLEFSDVIEKLAHERGGFSGIVAHSLGAAAAVLALGRGVRAAGVVLVGSPSDPSSFFSDFLSFLRVPAALAEQTTRRLEGKFGFRWADFDLSNAASRPDVPTLIIHDHDDAEVPFENGVRLAAAWPGAAFFETSGLGHRRVLRDPAVVAHVASFLTARPVSVPAPELAIETDLYEREARRERIFATG